MRAFVAIEVPALARADAVSAAPEHLTLAFLGELADEAIPQVREALRTAAGSSPAFALTLEGAGAFPSGARPRIVYQPVVEGAEEVRRLAARLRKALDERGIRFDPKPFVPHVTVLRVRGPQDEHRARELLSDPARLPRRSTVVHEVLLRSSELRPGGAAHATVDRCALVPDPSD
jgi:RNA 2',3'-cyclic 3'-phosphodiesterase